MVQEDRPYERHAERLTRTLDLSLPPVAVALAAEAPPGVTSFDGRVPSACSLWREAEHELFWADPTVHFDCPVGAFVMGFPLPDPVGEDLGDSLALMARIGYLDEDEGPSVPTMPQAATEGVLYGPLAQFPVVPDVVLLWIAARQAMLVSEAAGTADWREAPGARVLGRPACAALPLAVRDELPVLSFGCAGMRTFTAVPDHLGLAAVAGSRLDDFVQGVEETVEANATMGGHYRQRREQIAHSSP